MKSNSKTTQFAVAHRAYHFDHFSPAILDDSVETNLLAPPLSSILRYAPLRWLSWRPLFNKVQSISTFVAVLGRYCEDMLEKTIEAGNQQYVILGAGLDSWALRNEETTVTTFELDHAETQAVKREKRKAEAIDSPPGLNFVPIDFESTSLVEALSSSDFESGKQSYVSWLGTICYLTDEAIKETFASLAMVCAPGSRVCFDYFLPKEMMSKPELEFFELLNDGGTRRGEPMISLHSPEQIAEVLDAAGSDVVEDLSSSEIEDRYLVNRSDGLSVPGFVRLGCAEKRSLA